MLHQLRLHLLLVSVILLTRSGYLRESEIVFCILSEMFCRLVTIAV